MDRASVDKELLKSLHYFYAALETTDKRWKDIIKSTERNLEALKNQAEQLRHVTSPEVDNIELCQIDGLRETLIFKIHAAITEEVTAIQDAAIRLNNQSQDLKTRLIKIETVRSKLPFIVNDSTKEIMKGTPYRPKLDLLLEWAIDICDYYHELYSKINESLKALNYKDEKSIESLANAFVENEMSRAKIDRILAHTQFLARDISLTSKMKC